MGIEYGSWHNRTSLCLYVLCPKDGNSLIVTSSPLTIHFNTIGNHMTFTVFPSTLGWQFVNPKKTVGQQFGNYRSLANTTYTNMVPLTVYDV